MSSLPSGIHLPHEGPIYPSPCDCVDCQNGYYLPQEQQSTLFSYRGRVSDSDARRIAASHVQAAQQDRDYLRQRLASHGDNIINRWKKKSVDKRQAMLMEAVPELYEHRWLILRYCSTPVNKRWDCRNQVSRSQFLLPWLSLEVLKTNPAVLYGLLHNRTAYPPQDWAPYDSRQLILSWACGYFDVEYSDKCVIMYGPRYGKLVDWQAGPAHRADILGFPRARLVLEAQAFLMGSLRRIVDRLLEGVELSKPATSDKWKLVTSFGFKQTGTVELWSPYTNQAFSAPPTFNINNLMSIVQTRLDAASDHLWFLQTEPAYMRRYIRILYQGGFYKAAKREEAGALLVQELFKDFKTCSWWRWTKIEFDYAESVVDCFRDNVHPGERLPPRCDRALGALELLLVNRVIDCANHLSLVVNHRPGFRNRWSIEHRPDVGTSVFQLDRKSMTDTKEVFHEDPLEWCLLQMQGLPDKQTNFDHAMLFAFLEHHLAKSTPKERARLDETLYRKVSDLAAYHEMLVSVRLRRPQNEPRDMDEVKVSDNREAWKVIDLSIFLADRDSIRLGASLLEDFYEADVPTGPKNTAWLKQSQSIRKALEAFWTGLRECSHKLFNSSDFNTQEVLNTLKVIAANLSPEYIDVIQAEQDQVLASIERASIPGTDPLQREWGTSSTESAVPVSKPKVKTRLSQQPGAIEEIENGVAGLTLNSDEESSPVIAATKRAVDVFTLMYPATAEEAAKSVEWDSFVYAMSDVGFAARNGGGSVVIFENESLVKEGQSGKIIFHKPHPVAKIDPVMLHSMGKRMAKWFGWTRERFALEL
ncbi:hypothetical protein MMC30_007431 [Trapelia coarctata]|nr:hypothetical protein [Trapelia coarctata]